METTMATTIDDNSDNKGNADDDGDNSNDHNGNDDKATSNETMTTRPRRDTTIN